MTLLISAILIAQATFTQNIYVHWRDEQIYQAALDIAVEQPNAAKIEG